MNVENLNKLIEKLKTVEPKDFDMGVYECGTTACIAGWTKRIFAPNAHTSSAYREAMMALDLTDDEADDLFLESTAMSVSLPDAIDVLEHFRDTGEIDWSIA